MGQVIPIRIMGTRRRSLPSDDVAQRRLPIIEHPIPTEGHRLTLVDGTIVCACGATCGLYDTLYHRETP